MQAPDSPAAWIRNLGRNWKTGGTSVPYKANVQACFEECWGRFLALEMLEYQEGPEAMLRHLDFAIAYRTCSLKGSRGDKVAFRKAASEMKRQFRAMDNQLRVGVNILHMAFAISQRSLFGVWVLCMLGLTPNKISKMSQDERITFVYVLGSHSDGSSGASSRLVHPLFAPFVDVFVEGFLPALE